MDYVRNGSTHACYTDYPHVSPLLHLFAVVLTLPVFTMSLSRPLNKSSHLDPLTSRLSPTVTEYSVTQGSSSFSPIQSTGMDTTKILFCLRQGPRSLKQHACEFLAIANYSDLPDCILIEIFCDGVNQPLCSQLRREGPRSSQAHFMDFALLTVCSSFTVGVADEERDIAVTPPVQPACVMAATADPVRKMAAAPEHAHVMAAAPERAHVMAANTELRHVTAATSEPGNVTAAFPESSQVAAAFAESSHIPSDGPRSQPVMMASMLDPLLVTVRVANIPGASAPSNQTIKEVSSDHKSVPEVSSDHKSASEFSSDHKSAPEVSPVHKSVLEVSSDHESAPEASSVGEAVSMPPEVSAFAVVPPKEAAFTYELSASLLVLSASSLPALPRSQSMTRVPAPPWRAPAPSTLPWRAPPPPAPPPAPPWRVPALPVLPQSPGPLQGSGLPTLALSRPRRDFFRSAQTTSVRSNDFLVLHPGLLLPSSIAVIESAPVANQSRYKSPGLSLCNSRSIVVFVVVYCIVVLPSFLVPEFPVFSFLTWPSRRICLAASLLDSRSFYGLFPRLAPHGLRSPRIDPRLLHRLSPRLAFVTPVCCCADPACFHYVSVSCFE
ncbi:hypothetical protein M9458_056370 [Cirrhinus mrigala]|uniref:Uncharacterized protein n=1 Tax=Cirrhinus mrigala TaxID=683832 RepID=A0ABD0MJB9_CIRMR